MKIEYSPVTMLGVLRRGSTLLEQKSVVVALYTWADDVDRAGEDGELLRHAARLLDRELRSDQ